MFNVVWNIILFIGSVAALIWAASLAVKHLTQLARKFGLSEFFTAFILMAFATSIPEVFVGISSAIDQAPQIALGDTIGSNVIDLTLIVGLIALLGRGLSTDGAAVRKDLWILVAASLFPLFLGLDGSISRADGLLLLVFFAIYQGWQIKQGGRFQRSLEGAQLKTSRSLGWLALAAMVLIISSKLLIDASSHLALNIGLPEIFIGMTVVALGTSIPELAFGIRALKLGHSHMVLGDLLGASITNITLALGLTAVISGIPTANSSLFLLLSIAYPVMLTAFILTIRSRAKITISIALGLILMYVVFLFMEGMIK